MKQTVTKAKGDDVRALFDMAFSHERVEHDREQQAALVSFAHLHGLTHMLPESAHPLLHELSLPHKHEGTENETDAAGEPIGAGHKHTVVKAFNPVSKAGTIIKAWSVEADDYTHYEGWLSTPDKDLEKDITEPEAFLGDTLDDYFQRSAPVSYLHNGQTLPAGHLQKGAILRDGKVLQEASHPRDAAEFEHLPSSGSGVWVRGVITEEPVASSVRKGNTGGLSFIGNFTEFERLPGGGKRYLKISPLIESTVAPYPVNPKAAIRVAKAFGLEETPQMEFDLETILAEAGQRLAEKRAAEDAANKVQKGITTEDLGELLAQFEARLSAKFEEVTEQKVQKAFSAASVPARGEGAGRKGTMSAVPTPAEDRDSNPASYLVKKAAEGHDKFDDVDRTLAAELTIACLKEGMTYDESEN